MQRSLVVGLFLSILSLSRAEYLVENTRSFTDPGSGLTVVAGEVKLPAGMYWRAAEPSSGSGVRQVFLQPSKGAIEQLKGERMQKAERERKVEEARYPLHTLFWSCTQYATENGGVGPASWLDLAARTNLHLPWKPAELGTNYFLVPGVAVSNDFRRTPGRELPVVIELRPYVDDGKHWIAFNNGLIERRPIDKALAEKYGLKIEPQVTAEIVPSPKADDLAVYQILGLRDAAAKEPVTITLRNRRENAALECRWDLAAAAPGDAETFKLWASLRAAAWAALTSQTDAPILDYWLSRYETLYGTARSLDERFGPPRGQRTDAFSVLGGRAAVRETLQMEAIRGTSSTDALARTLPVSGIPGVEVKSHPFEEMLGGQEGGSLSLADAVPADRAFVYFGKPAALFPLLDKGVDFLYQGGSMAMQNDITYNVKEKYLSRLGITEDWIRTLMNNGAVKELALVFPDLFFIDGTEATVIARIPSASLAVPALKLLGLGSLVGKPVAHSSKSGGTSYWVLDGDVLVISTSRAELEKVLALRASRGAGSLGRSAEFRYMLTRLPLNPETRFYAYLSDPFIRRLVGPDVKIGQLRRLQARTDLERLSAAALLYRLDGQPGKPTLDALVSKGYVPAEFSARDYALDDSLVSHSTQYGTPSDLKSLLDNPVDRVTPGEAEAYKVYVDQYTQYWRGYFDPIAFRLDEQGASRLEMTTYILPLIDNTIYNGVKGAVQAAEAGSPLRIPDMKPLPVVLLSMNLADDAWVNVTKGFISEFLGRYTHINPQIFDQLGPSVHIAIHDADPVLALGGGDILGAFGGSMLGGAGHGEMLAIPILLSVLTRPCQILVEVKDQKAVVGMLQTMASAVAVDHPGWGPQVTFYRTGAGDAWICSIDVEGVIKIRFGIEVQNGYLVLSNIPWTQRPAIAGTRPAQLNAIDMQVFPEACVQQLPSLFTATAERERTAAIRGVGYLYPLLLGGAATVPEAAAMDASLFGFTPQHPAGGEWTWDGNDVRSSVYGALDDQKQPDYQPGNRDFGLFTGVSNITVNLQFEDAGLRVVSGWDSGN